MFNPKITIMTSLAGGFILLAVLAFQAWRDPEDPPSVALEGIDFKYVAEEFGNKRCQPKRIARVDWKKMGGLAEVHGTITFVNTQNGTSNEENLRVTFDREDKNGIAIKTNAWSVGDDIPCANLRIEQTVTHCLYRSTRQTSKRNGLWEEPYSTKRSCPIITVAQSGYAGLVEKDESQTLPKPE